MQVNTRSYLQIFVVVVVIGCGSADSHYSILPNGSLIISSVSGADEGLYRCVAANKAGQQGKEIRAIVNRSNDKERPIPREATSTVVVTMPHNDSADSSVPAVHRTRNCVEYEDISFGPNPELLPAVVSPPPPQASDSISPQPPYFTALPPQCVQSLVGYRIVLNCSAGGTPRPSIVWEKDGEQLWTPQLDVRKLIVYEHTQFSPPT